MNPKQRAFAVEYLKDHNATKAAERAGYSKKTAYSQGARLLKHAEICKFLETKVSRAGMTADEVLNVLAEVARGAERDSDRVAAAGLLGKYHKLFTDKTEHSGEVTVKVVTYGSGDDSQSV